MSNNNSEGEKMSSELPRVVNASSLGRQSCDACGGESGCSILLLLSEPIEYEHMGGAICRACMVEWLAVMDSQGEDGSEAMLDLGRWA